MYGAGITAGIQLADLKPKDKAIYTAGTAAIGFSLGFGGAALLSSLMAITIPLPLLSSCFGLTLLIQGLLSYEKHTRTKN